MSVQSLITPNPGAKDKQILGKNTAQLCVDQSSKRCWNRYSNMGILCAYVQTVWISSKYFSLIQPKLCKLQKKVSLNVA